ncbi:hypothetical protein HHK36_026343 [Tetracentron sinense]|uniref:CG-1 domain-containing protein n=1 Tax=Tetracentron sinense TaxID=13715 RepID=A0A834YEV2_TETSI|nr:hypothetical protein HHK36_026343 [Tetracentron sinense]
MDLEDLTQIQLEAQNRWLRPTEICEILRNYQKFCLTPDPPYRPPGGSLFLFDRKALRYFRKDGHCWRKKKDGKTVREAHEKLKAGSVDVLHCYYAHGEDNENFQRRSYWMLDGQETTVLRLRISGIVIGTAFLTVIPSLVVLEEELESLRCLFAQLGHSSSLFTFCPGNRSGISRLINADPATQTGSPQTSSAPCLAQANSPALTVQASYASSPSTAGWNGQTPSSEFEDVDSGDDLGTSSLAERISSSEHQNASLHANETAGFSEFLRIHPGAGFTGASFIPNASSSVWAEIHNSSRNLSSMQDQKIYFDQSNGADFVTVKLSDTKLDAYGMVKDVLTGGDRVFPDAAFQSLVTDSQRIVQVPQEHDFHLVHPQFQNNSGSHMIPAASDPSFGFENNTPEGGSINDESGELKKLDSFGRWMNKEIGGDCDDSFMASDSGNYWNALDAQNDDKEVSSLSRHMQLDIESLGPSLSKEQLFSICDFSPDWAYSGVETKVLVSGTFLGDVKHPSGTKWCCMFGEVEASAEVLTNNVLRCHAPVHAPGRVPFYITCSNRLSCSEVREFEYREKTSGVRVSVTVKSVPEDEMRLQIRLAKMLHIGLERKFLDCSVENCDKCSLKNDIFSMRSDDEKEWGQIEKTALDIKGNYENCRGALIQKLLKDRLYEWLVCKVHEGGKGPHILDDEGQGVIHLAAALGYEWAMGPIVSAGISPSFRDAHGRTGLHWAACFGREETVVALVRLGAAPGAVEDPTAIFPGGQTAADLASSRGHKGIAGYLAEADLTSHLSSLTLKESVMDSVAATIAAEKAIEIAEEQSVVPPDGGGEEQVSLKRSLAAVRKSAQAAALIQAAFRVHSFRHRQLTKSSNDNFEVSSSTDLVALASLNSKAQKLNHFSDYLHSAAVKIQQKYRGWRGRKEFLKIRNRIVKIQAHVRGHQVRKQYKKVIWSVSIVEKAILRWRRKGAGLRGFRAEKAIRNIVPEVEKTDEYAFLRLGRKQKVAGVEKALARVQSMVRHPEARDQYMRLVAKFEKSKIGDEGSRTSLQVESLGKSKAAEDPLAHMID